MSVEDRRRHQFGRLATGIAEHDALIASALVLVAGGVDPLRDIGGLLMHVAGNLRHIPMEALLLVADLPNGLARHFDEPVAADIAGTANPPAQAHATSPAHRLHAAA